MDRVCLLCFFQQGVKMNNNANQPRKPTTTTMVITVIAAVIGSTVGSLAVRQFNRPPPVNKILVATCNEINKMLPMMVDEATRLKATSPGPGNMLTYHYTLLDVTGEKIHAESKEEFIRNTRILAMNNYRTSPDMWKLRELSTVLRYCYYSEDGNYLFDFQVDPKQFANNDDLK